ncbi:NlpC/P60 family protein [Protaetiibacter intestinalis]|uniref:NlpC/P60 family protein n=1 Tax=Protaetiibacter intestinalis TaxID=2419774 RepID=A0A387B504_9MICO|nr:NlpC/P60 family protein [Protaetiibacter intestinalis]
MALVVPGLFATVALPAYAYNPSNEAAAPIEARAQLIEQNAQTVAVAEADVAVDARDGYSTTSAAELRRAAQRAALRSYSGPTVRDYLANPPYPSFNLDQVVQVALQYQGIPYVYGGSTPAGFDCSGFTMFIYAQFGIALPHSSSAQGRGSGGGHLIARADALPGDLVVMDGGGHVGIYMGGNTMVHSPKPGRTVEVHNIWDSNAWFVRYGI